MKGQEITMFMGFFDYQFYQDNERISKKEVSKLFATHPKSKSHWERSKTFNTLSWVAVASEIGFAVGMLNETTPHNKVPNSAITQIGFYGSIAAALTFNILEHAQKKKAILSYNQGLEKKTTFKIQPSKKGIGIAIVF